MVLRDPEQFQWNYTGEAQAISVLETLPSSIAGLSQEALAGQFLVDIASSLRQLRKSYLNTGQRERLAELLRERYLHFQRLGARVKDKETHERISRYLSILGTYGITLHQNGEEQTLTLLEAVATGNMVPWTHGLYNAHHQLVERDSLGREIRFEISDTCICDERDARHALMHWLLEEE